MQRERCIPKLTLLASIALTAMTAAAEPPPPEATRIEPDHLVPVHPYHFGPPSKYTALWNRLLYVAPYKEVPDSLPKLLETVVMIRRPSFEPDECIALRERDGEKTYELIHLRANHNIWYSMPENRDEAEPPVQVKVTTVTRPLDRDRARRVFTLWNRMLLGVRYPDKRSKAFVHDPDTYEFRYASKGMFGQTSSPLEGAMELLVALGDSMIACCKSPDAELARNLAEVDKSCDALEKYLDAKDKPKPAHPN